MSNAIIYGLFFVVSTGYLYIIYSEYPVLNKMHRFLVSLFSGIITLSIGWLFVMRMEWGIFKEYGFTMFILFLFFYYYLLNGIVRCIVEKDGRRRGS
jgi:hypothetical protein